MSRRCYRPAEIAIPRLLAVVQDDAIVMSLRHIRSVKLAGEQTGIFTKLAFPFLRD